MRRLVGSALFTATAVLIAGCTEGGQEVRADDGADAAATVAAAAASATQGRFRQLIRLDSEAFAFDESGTESVEMATEGEFSGTDVRATTKLSAGDTVESEMVVVGNAVYVGAAAYEQPGLNLTGQDALAAEMAQQAAAARELIAGREWIQVTDEADAEDESDESLGDAAFFGAMFGVAPVETPAVLLEGLSAVEEQGTVEVDGETLRRFEGRIPDTDWVAGDKDSLDPDDDAAKQRFDRIVEYYSSRVYTRAVVDLDADGNLRRIELSEVDDAEEQFDSCYFGPFGQSGVTFDLELFDLDHEPTIEAPDPATVVPPEEFEELLSSMFAAGFGSDEELLGADALDEDQISQETAAMLDAQLLDGASLIGLDPSTIAAMSTTDKLDTIDRIDEAAESLPTYDTPMGPQNRLDMLEMIRFGVSALGVPEFDPSTYSDEQLAEMITGYMDAEMGLGGGEEGDWFNYAPNSGSMFSAGGEDSDQFEDCPA